MKYNQLFILCILYSDSKCRLWNQKDTGWNLRSAIYNKQLHYKYLDNVRFHREL